IPGVAAGATIGAARRSRVRSTASRAIGIASIPTIGIAGVDIAAAGITTGTVAAVAAVAATPGPAVGITRTTGVAVAAGAAVGAIVVGVFLLLLLRRL